MNPAYNRYNYHFNPYGNQEYREDSGEEEAVANIDINCNSTDNFQITNRDDQFSDQGVNFDENQFVPELNSQDLDFNKDNFSIIQESNTDFQETVQNVNEITISNFFDDQFNQGRIVVPKAFPRKNVKPITHKNGVFGSYCLEDVLALVNLVNENWDKSKALPSLKREIIHYDCFNYETVEELTSLNQIGAIFERNLRKLNNLKEENKLSFDLHYEDKHNDLLQNKRDTVAPSEDWNKFSRRFSQNMIFFNPYYQNREGTTRLIRSFFNYAQTNLDDNGVVTIMWNPNRTDSLKSVYISQLANKAGLTIVKKLSGREFTEITDFTHLKNDKSLTRAINNRSSKVYVTSKSTDTLMMFKKQKSGRKIPKTNIIASTLANTLTSI